MNLSPSGQKLSNFSVQDVWIKEDPGSQLQMLCQNYMKQACILPHGTKYLFSKNAVLFFTCWGFSVYSKYIMFLLSFRAPIRGAHMQSISLTQTSALPSKLKCINSCFLKLENWDAANINNTPSPPTHSHTGTKMNNHPFTYLKFNKAHRHKHTHLKNKQ